MVRGLRVRHRIGLLVVIASAALVTTTGVTLVLGRQSQRELAGIETRYVPLIELDRDLKTASTAVARALEDAAGAADEGRLADADQLARDLLQHLTDGRATLVRNGADPAMLEAAFRAYFTRAREVSAAIVAGTSMAELGPQIEAMGQAQQAFVARLDAATSPDRRGLAAAFETARKSHDNAVAIEIAVAIGAIGLMGLLSWWITRRMVRSLHDVSVGVGRFARGEFAEPIRVSTSDEFGDLAREANHTAAQLRETRQALQERAEAAENATRELEAFSYSVAHDLRAPLRAINGFSAALVEELGDKLDDEARDYLARISGGAVRMGELIDALLALSRVTRAELARQPVNLSKAANEVLAQLRASDPTRIVLCQVEDDVTVEGDPQLLRALLENLLGNAWKFVAKRDGARIEFGRSPDGRSFFVRDNGAGFDMAYASKLFTPFQRLHTEAEYTGTGIGLATVQRIIRRHGGTIWAEGAVGLGATFHFTLAAAELA